MSPRPRFEKLDDEKKKTILSAAAEEFGDKGFEGASLNKIIEKAGISKGATYYYFDDKADLYTTVLENLMGRLAEWIGGFTLAALERETFWEQLTDYSIRSLRYMQQHPYATRLWRNFYALADNHGASPAARGILEAARSWTRRFIERGQELGVMRDDLPMDLMVETHLSLGMGMDRWLLKHLDDLEADDIESNAEMLVDIYRSFSSPREE